ncbi:phage antirepressor protein [Candidatus Woesearchaeota archaeon]|nr:MAG: phage antirepressor protein [Candidatus Woesearchaeota archaeon]
MVENNLAIFQGNNIRRVWHDNEWYFSVIDVVHVLTDSNNPRNYWSMLKKRELEHGIELSTNCVQLKMESPDGKLRETDCANTESLFRIIQSIPSKKAEPFKLWLAKVGYERVKEIENPELAQERMKIIYKEKGYSDEWIEKRVRGISIRQELTDEWKNRGVNHDFGFAILTNEISKATFGKSVEEYKKFKNLENENLRDHMDDTELILTMLGENVTTRFTRERDSKRFNELKKDANDGGSIAADTRKNIEDQIGKSVVSNENYLTEPEKIKRKRINR